MNDPWGGWSGKSHSKGNERGQSGRASGADKRASEERPAARDELRLYGFNAVQAVFAQRPEAIRKVYLSEPRIAQLQALLAWCVKERIGYRVVDEADLGKLAASSHHEGVVADVLKTRALSLEQWLQDLPPGPIVALWLDGVGNPHNFGAILRSAAHFGVAGILQPPSSDLALSGAAARVAEGGAEQVPLVRMAAVEESLQALHDAGFQLAATLASGGGDLFATTLPQRLVYVMGAEAQGMDAGLARQCDLRLSIPGSGAVESLNVAAATAVFLSRWTSTRRDG